jgi:nitrate/TMAO reductase-like tetraheme cytochrome c subunit
VSVRRLLALAVAVTLSALAAWAMLPERALAQTARNERCLACHAQSSLSTVEVNGQLRSLRVNTDYWQRSVHSRMDCTACHVGFRPGKHTAAQTEGWWQQATLKSCANCHAEEFNMYKGSFHGNLVMNKQSTNAPTCGDCHGSHAIVDPTSSEFRTSIPNICGRCHTERRFTYGDTYHGQAVELGGTSPAVCTDCHGTHKILPPSNPASLVSSKNIVATCRKCHPRANSLFATYLVHVDRGNPRSSLVIWTMDIAHAALIGVLFTFGASHCLLYFYRGRKEKLYGRRAH